MKKTYEVLVKAFSVVVVTCEDNDDPNEEPVEKTLENFDFGNLELDDAGPAVELVDQEKIDIAKSHANLVIEDRPRVS